MRERALFYAAEKISLCENMALSVLLWKGQLSKFPCLFQCRWGLYPEDNCESLILAFEEDSNAGAFSQL